MGTGVTITDAASGAYTFYPPNYGYTVALNMALLMSQRADGSIGAYDQGTTYDYRTVSFDWQLDATDMRSLHNIFRTAAQSRGKSISFTLPTGSGVYPAGPDRGDAGTFQLRLVNTVNHEGTKNGPWQYFTTQTPFLVESYPDYTVPAVDAEGPLRIGTVDTLRFPPEFADPTYIYAIDTAITRGGIGYNVDRWTTADVYNTSMRLVLNNANAGQLVKYLVETARGTTFRVYPVNGGWLFGVDYTPASYSYYNCKLTSPKIEMTNTMHNRWEIELDVRLKEAVA